MTSAMREHLVGYWLGALEEDERERVEQALENDADLRDDYRVLDMRLSDLRDDGTSYEPPVGLAARTCDRIAAFANGERVVGLPARFRSSPPEYAPGNRRWTAADFIVSGAVCLAVLLLLMPAIAYSRFQSQVSACQNNLRELAIALQAYSEHHDSFFPPVPAEGKFSVAGNYALVLSESGLVNNAGYFLCPTSPEAQALEAWTTPTRQAIIRAEGEALLELRRRMGGSFAYTLGYLRNGKLIPTRNLGRPYFVIMSDAPVMKWIGRGAPGEQPVELRSAFHGGRGQNVLYEDGHIKFVVGCPSDDCRQTFYLNSYCLPSAGVDVHDAVVGASETPPITYIER